MNQFAREALFIGIREGLKLALCTALALSFFKSIGREELRRPLIAGIVTVFLASFAALSAPVTIGIRETLSKMIGYVFGLFYIFRSYFWPFLFAFHCAAIRNNLYIEVLAALILPPHTTA